MNLYCLEYSLNFLSYFDTAKKHGRIFVAKNVILTFKVAQEPSFENQKKGTHFCTDDFRDHEPVGDRL